MFSPSLSRSALALLPAVAGVLLAGAGCMPKPPPGRALTNLTLTISGQPRQLAVERRLIDEFERLNPDVRVDAIVLSGDARTKLQSMIAGNAAPDVFSFTVDNYATFAKSGALLDLDPFLARDPLNLDDIYELPKRIFLYRGKRYALGLQSSGLVLYYNADLFRQAGVAEPTADWTWEDFLRASEGLVRRRANNPGRVETYGTVNPQATLPFMACGGRLVDDPLRPTRPAITEPESIAGLELVERIARSAGTLPPEVGVDANAISQRFVNGKVAMFFDGRWRTPDLAGMKARWNVVPVPRGVNGRHVTFYGGTGVGVSSQTMHPEAAWRLARFYLTPEGQRIAMEGGRLVPVYRSIVESPEYRNLMPGVNMGVFADTMLPGAAESLCSAPGVGTRLVTAFFDSASDLQLGVKTPQQAAEKIAFDIARDIQLYGADD